MKRMLRTLLLILTICIWSCKKTHHPTRPDSEFSFTAAGKQFVWNGSLFQHQGSIIDRDWYLNQYLLVAYNTFDNYLSLKFPPGPIQPGTYTVTCKLKLDNVHYDFSSKGTVIITSLENHLAAGSFSGEVNSGANSIPVVIANGVFQNVVVK